MEYVETGFALTHGRAIVKRRMIASFVLTAAAAGLGGAWLAVRPPARSGDISGVSMGLGAASLFTLLGAAPAMARGSRLARYAPGVHGQIVLRVLGWVAWLGGVGGLIGALAMEDGAQMLHGTPLGTVGVALSAVSFASFGLDAALAYSQSNRRRRELTSTTVGGSTGCLRPAGLGIATCF